MATGRSPSVYQSLQACGIAEGGLSGGLCQEGVSGKRAKQTFQPVRWDTGVWFPRIGALGYRCLVPSDSPWQALGTGRFETVQSYSSIFFRPASKRRR